ncbi:MAG: hypothetical protein H0T92_25210 [Pyrinomonadaceae bacterium]|nr:hypothetical protein [Pyrinomonadaceae bacterium]
MTKRKEIGNEAGEADNIKPASDARHGLRLIPSIGQETKIRMPADESLRELLEAFKRPHKDRRQSADDGALSPAA